MDIQGKVAVITGGASGIGAGLAKRFAAEGARGIVLADLNLERAQGVAKEAGPNAIAVQCDVSREADIQALVAAARGKFGQVDIFMSNAGILGRMGGIELSKRLRQTRPDLPILFVTGYVDQSESLHDSAAGTPVLLKPFSPEALLRAVSSTLQK